MNINGHEVTIEQIANAVATAYATASIAEQEPTENGCLENAINAYLNAYKMVTALDEDYINALL